MLLRDVVQLRLLVILAFAGLVTSGAHAQSVGPSRPDSVLRSILVRIEADMRADGYHPVRVISRVSGRFHGHKLRVRGDTAVVIERDSVQTIALADIDSVWFRRDAGRDMSLVFGGLCAFIGGAFAGVIVTGPDSGSGSPLPAIAIGATVSGAICGAAGWLVGSLIQSWRLEYPVPLESST